jgi:PEP-CTERM motif-containing protein
VQDNSTPGGVIDAGSVYYSVFGSSWNPSDYPYLTFWTTGNDGGVTAGTIPGESGTNLFNTFQSTEGTGQVFTVSVPEPSTWALMLLGFAGVGLSALRRNAMRRRRAIAA